MSEDAKTGDAGYRRRKRSLPERVLRALVSLLDPRALIHPLRLVHYYNYTHVQQVRKLTLGEKVRIAPNASFSNGERIQLGDRVQVGARCSLWAGDSSSWIRVGADTTFGPDCMVTASNYGSAPGQLVVDQPKDERDIIIGRDVWLGAKTLIAAGVTIGDGAIVGGNSVVTRDLPAGCIAAGAPAKPLKMRDGSPVPA